MFTLSLYIVFVLPADHSAADITLFHLVRFFHYLALAEESPDHLAKPLEEMSVDDLHDAADHLLACLLYTSDAADEL